MHGATLVAPFYSEFSHLTPFLHAIDAHDNSFLQESAAHLVLPSQYLRSWIIDDIDNQSFYIVVWES